MPGLGNLTPGNEETPTVTVIDARAQAGTRIATSPSRWGDAQRRHLSNDPDTLEVDDLTALVGGNPDISVVKTVEESVADNVWRIGETVRYRGGSKQGTVDALDLASSTSSIPTSSRSNSTVMGHVADGRITGIERLDAAWTTPATAVLGAVPDGTSVNQASIQPAGSNQPILSDDPALPGEADTTNLTLTAQEGVTLLKTVEDLNGAAARVIGVRHDHDDQHWSKRHGVLVRDTLDDRLELIVEPGVPGDARRNDRWSRAWVVSRSSCRSSLRSLKAGRRHGDPEPGADVLWR